MTGPIKPPGGSGPPPAPDAAEPAPGGDGVPFRVAADGNAPAAHGAAAEPPLAIDAALLADLRSGGIDRDTFVSRLVDDAIASVAGRTLDPARRAELESFIRGRLAEDPTLSAILAELSGG